jgi:hypothetical protein
MTTASASSDATALRFGLERSYPTCVPLGAAQICDLRDAVEPFEYSAMYGDTWDRVIDSNASKIVARTAARYLDVLGASETTA